MKTVVITVLAVLLSMPATAFSADDDDLWEALFEDGSREFMEPADHPAQPARSPSGSSIFPLPPERESDRTLPPDAEPDGFSAEPAPESAGREEASGNDSWLEWLEQDPDWREEMEEDDPLDAFSQPPASPGPAETRPEPPPPPSGPEPEAAPDREKQAPEPEAAAPETPRPPEETVPPAASEPEDDPDREDAAPRPEAETITAPPFDAELPDGSDLPEFRAPDPPVKFEEAALPPPAAEISGAAEPYYPDYEETPPNLGWLEESSADAPQPGTFEELLRQREGAEIEHGGRTYLWRDGEAFEKDAEGRLTAVEAPEQLYVVDDEGQKWLSREADGTVYINVAPRVWALINFAHDSDAIEDDSKPVLDIFGLSLSTRALAHHRLIIAGHTNNLGRPGYNLELSRRRAQSVARYLAETHRIDPARLILHGYGDTRPMADNDTYEGLEQNRRVEFILLNPPVNEQF